MTMAPRIKVTKDGPYLVTGGVPLVLMAVECDAEGTPCAYRKLRDIPAGETYALCRCGQSATPPFCDGSHKRNRFEGEEVAPKEPAFERLDGPELTLLDDETLCAGTGFCHLGEGTWEMVERSDDPKWRALAIESAQLCPSGRLVMLDAKTGASLEAAEAPSIAVLEEPEDGVSGPLWIRGRIALESADGSVYEIREKMTLCRCGKSSNMPFCDGMHRPFGFDDEL
jgi:CDGSH-type Zn-finger protein